MKIFIIEDSFEKSKEIENLLDRIDGVSLEVAEEYVQARDKIIKYNYDILILDMTLPRANDTRKFRSYAGKELMFDMIDMDIEIPTIVITGYLDFGNTCKTDKIYEKLPVMLRNENYGREFEEDLEKVYDFSDFYGMHEFLSENIPFYLGIIYFQLQRTDWKRELLKLIEERMK